jgi:hypothetical protein
VKQHASHTRKRSQELAAANKETDGVDLAASPAARSPSAASCAASRSAADASAAFCVSTSASRRVSCASTWPALSCKQLCLYIC